ncbi:MAG: nitroreductase family protein [Sphingomonadaceae bacterium]
MTERQTHPEVLPLITERWSPRAFDGSKVSLDDLQTIFTAAGLAPSAYNYQPWTFLYSRRDDEYWDSFLGLLLEFNQAWVKNASALVFIVSDTKLRLRGQEPKDSHSHSFDAGAAWAMMALQAHHMGLRSHGMVGIDFDKARKTLNLPSDYRLEAGIAIGRQAPRETLPEPLREREIISGRKLVVETICNGPMTK